MVRKLEDAREATGDASRDRNLSIPLYKEEKQSIVPGPMNWVILMTRIKAFSEVFAGGDRRSEGGEATNRLINYVEEINADIRRWIDGYEERNSPRIAFLGFEYHWKILRVWVSLQLRLCIEQCLYEKGYPWDTLVTGFRPIERRRKPAE